MYVWRPNTETDKRKSKKKKISPNTESETIKYIHLNTSVRRGADFGNQEKRVSEKNSDLLNCGNVQQVVVGDIY